jgi:hypothetical protein
MKLHGDSFSTRLYARGRRRRLFVTTPTNNFLHFHPHYLLAYLLEDGLGSNPTPPGTNMCLECLNRKIFKNFIDLTLIVLYTSLSLNCSNHKDREPTRLGAQAVPIVSKQSYYEERDIRKNFMPFYAAALFTHNLSPLYKRCLK